MDHAQTSLGGTPVLLMLDVDDVDDLAERMVAAAERSFRFRTGSTAAADAGGCTRRTRTWVTTTGAR
jgi:hypothetical protein